MYTFNTLNDKDLEELVLDLLNKNLNLNFQSFKKGRDKGIDLRYSNSKNENEIIVQVKHYINSGYNQLKYNLKNKELEKVRNLNPRRYILATSIGLSPPNKEEIKEFFSPYILSTQDIYGQDELNSLLRDYKEVETKHFKLWLSSTNVLNRIISKGVLGRSEFTREKIEQKIKLFVPNSTYSKSVALLNEYNFLLIIGEPGVGKTMLANILTYKLLEKEYELISVYDIKEAEELYDIDKKQVFYFDDFLGANYFDLSIARNNDSAIVHFIERIINSKNKKLILTSRTIILNKAKDDSEKILNSKIDVSKYEVKINNYSNYHKAKILYNHIFFSELNWKNKVVFFENKFYKKIINHKNYSPRIIDFFTDLQKIKTETSNKEIDNKNYKKIVIEKLNNPQDIWKKSYEKQISYASKIFLNTLFSLNVRTEKNIKSCFKSRIEFELKNSGLKKEYNQYNSCINELLGGFIVRKINNHTNFSYNSITFFNPSIIDFLINYLSKINKDENWNILKSAIYFDQFTYRYTTEIDAFQNKGKIFIEKENIDELFAIFSSKYDSLTSVFSDVSSEIKGINTCFKLFDFKYIRNFVCSKLGNQTLIVGIKKSSSLNEFMQLLTYLTKYDLATSYTEIIKNILIQIITEIKSFNDLLEINEFIENNSFYQSFLKQLIEENASIKNTFEEKINSFWESNYYDFLLDAPEINDVYNKEELMEIIEKRKGLAETINFNLSLPPSDVFDYEEFDYQGFLYENEKAMIKVEKHLLEERDDFDYGEEYKIESLFQIPD